jgi:FkbM family methyltransferase
MQERENNSTLPYLYRFYGFLDRCLYSAKWLRLYGKSPTIVLRNYLNRFMFRYVLTSNEILTVECRDGFVIRVPMNDQAAASIIFEGRYSPSELSILSKLAPLTSGFIDLGANLGYFSLFMRTRTHPNYPIIVVEPNTFLCGLIEDSIRFNDFDKFSIISAAVGSVKDTVFFLVDENRSSSGKVVSQVTEKTCVTESITVNDIIDWARERQPYLIKVDVEGMELDVLRGSTEALQARAIFICEIFNKSFVKIKAFLNEYDYMMVDFEGREIVDEIFSRSDLLLVPMERLDRVKQQLLLV